MNFCRMSGSGTIDVLYSSNTLQYVADVLRVFEEGYRVLKNGGIGYWDVDLRDISAVPGFIAILDATAGGKDVFEYVKCNEQQGFIVCRKSSKDKFRGFPFRLFREIKYEDLEGAYRPKVDELAAFYRNAVYKAANSG